MKLQPKPVKVIESKDVKGTTVNVKKKPVVLTAVIDLVLKKRVDELCAHFNMNQSELVRGLLNEKYHEIFSEKGPVAPTLTPEDEVFFG